MRHTIRHTVFFLILALTTAAYAAVPALKVIVSDASGRVAFKGLTHSDSTFVTPNLAPGDYVVQFASTNAELKGNQYLLVISAGKKKVIADAVAGEQFAGGGVAMKVQVGSGLRITGQVANEESALAKGMTKIRIVDGKRYVWVPAHLGSNLGPHWELEGVAKASNVSFLSMETMRRMQDRTFEGSMLDRYNTGTPTEVAVHGEGY